MTTLLVNCEALVELDGLRNVPRIDHAAPLESYNGDLIRTRCVNLKARLDEITQVSVFAIT